MSFAVALIVILGIIAMLCAITILGCINTVRELSKEYSRKHILISFLALALMIFVGLPATQAHRP